MPRYVCLIRGINVGGHKLVKMAELRACLTDLGLEDVRTFLQSGNVVFDSAEASPGSLETLIEREMAVKCGVDAQCIVRTARSFVAMAETNPFADEAEHDPGHVLLMIGHALPTDEQIAEVQARYPGTERVRRVGEALYVHCPDGIGVSRLLSASAWSKLTSSLTARNWNTVRTISNALAS